MPITYTIDREARLIRVSVRGEFSVAAMADAVLRCASEAGEPGFNIISDHREIGTPATRPLVEHMTALMVQLRAQFAGARWAVLVSSPASYGMMRMLGVHLESVPITLEVFEDAAAAESWVTSAKG